MSAEWNGTAHQHGQASCDDSDSKAEFTFVEAEIDNDQQALGRLNTALNGILGKQICIYGPWIYDKGHCCHSEIHPAEQIWWGDSSSGGTVYFFNVFCDESKRFWWRDQMDDGTKLKPWGAPPITGTFAIAFEAQVNTPAKEYHMAVQDAYNHVTVADNIQNHNLVYQNNTLVSVVQDTGNPVKISFENVGLVAPDTVRGFVVIEATVGKVIQNPNPIRVLQGVQVQEINLPTDSDPNQVSQNIERAAFTKQGGRLMLMITSSGGTVINTVLDLNGTWQSGGAAGPVISVNGTTLLIDMSAYNRPSAYGSIIDGSNITVTFPDDATYTGTLQAPWTIVWSNGSSWTKPSSVVFSPGRSHA